MATESGYLTGVSSEDFDVGTYLVQRVRDRRVLGDEPGADAIRRELTRLDPLLFGLIYCPKLLMDDNEQITLCDLHFEICRYALTWVTPPAPREARDAFVAPRESGKSTWLFKIIPLWAAAHGHARFFAAFSSSTSQALKHLAGFRRQIETNTLLRHDFPDMCTPARRPGGNYVANTYEVYHSSSGFTFTAAGLDSEVLGLVDPLNRRPDKIILDDVEPGEAQYSIHQKKKRQETIVSTILALNERAHVALTGTVTMVGSMVHELVESLNTTKKPAQWIIDEKFRVKHILPIVTTEDGRDRSIWPGKWPLEYLLSIRHTYSYKKNFENKPVRESGDYWTPETFVYGKLEDCDRTILQIDPAVTSKTSSDETAFAVVSWHRAERKCMVRYARGFRLSPSNIRKKVLELLERYPEIGLVRIEVNQGGDTWKSVLHSLPVRLLVHSESVPKNVRAKTLLNHYERFRVLHEQELPELEEQMCSFPDVLHDDLIDAAGAGVQFLINRAKGNRTVVAKTVKYA